MTVEIVDLPIVSMVIFHSFLYVYQRVIGMGNIFCQQKSMASFAGWLAIKTMAKNQRVKLPVQLVGDVGDTCLIEG